VGCIGVGMAKKATPEDAYVAVKSGKDGFVGDWHRFNDSIRLFADCDKNEVVAVPVSDRSKEFAVSADKKIHAFSNAFSEKL